MLKKLFAYYLPPAFFRAVVAESHLYARHNPEISACYGLRVPFRSTQPPLQKRWCTMLWPSRKKMITMATTNKNLPIPNQGVFGPAGPVVFE
jgi:hypothetical protein